MEASRYLADLTRPKRIIGVAYLHDLSQLLIRQPSEIESDKVHWLSIGMIENANEFLSIKSLRHDFLSSNKPLLQNNYPLSNICSTSRNVEISPLPQRTRVGTR